MNDSIAPTLTSPLSWQNALWNSSIPLAQPAQAISQQWKLFRVLKWTMRTLCFHYQKWDVLDMESLNQNPKQPGVLCHRVSFQRAPHFISVIYVGHFKWWTLTSEIAPFFQRERSVWFWAITLLPISQSKNPRRSLKSVRFFFFNLSHLVEKCPNNLASK